jgi:predicted nucleic acid-binding protein
MLRKWALNASPIIALGKIDRLNLINELCQEIVIPKGVAEEIAQGPPDDQALEWLRQPGKDWVRDVGNIKNLILPGIWDKAKVKY